MSFRSRLFLGILVAVLLPLAALAYGVRTEMERRLTDEYGQRAASLAAAIEADLRNESAAVARQLSALASDLTRDNRFRVAALQRDPAMRRYLLDYAGEAMRLSGLAMLQIQDSAGRILSSGHFRNEFDQLQPDLPRLLSTAPTLWLIRTRTPETPLLALARVDSFQVGGRRFNLVGGIGAEAPLLERLNQSPDLAVRLDHPGADQPDSLAGRVVRKISLPYLDLLSDGPPSSGRAALIITQSGGTLQALQRSVDRWFIVAVALTVALALALAAWLSSRISRPLSELASKTSAIDLDRLDQSFETERTDEIGALSRLLGRMTERLRASTARLREAERRAAVGELARQINHDIKNGLAPIRNVLRHFSQVAEQDPASLPRVYEERRDNLVSSVEYLETLARNYARLSPATETGPCDVNQVVAQVVRGITAHGAQIKVELDEPLPLVRGDGLMLRRILENLIGNAVESLHQLGGTVTITTKRAGPHGENGRVWISVADTGRGMSREELNRAFDDFYTTKPGGTGLGLSIVRRLILDLDGTLRVETEPGTGTRFMIDLPIAGQATP